MDASLKNGFTFKGISRFKHSVYHYGATLPGAELDRFKSKDSLFSAFPAVAADASLVPTAGQADLLVRMMKSIDTRLFKRRYSDSEAANHIAQLDETRNLLHIDNPKVVTVPLNTDEAAYWSTGVPRTRPTPQVVVVGDWRSRTFGSVEATLAELRHQRDGTQHIGELACLGGLSQLFERAAVGLLVFPARKCEAEVLTRQARLGFAAVDDPRHQFSRSRRNGGVAWYDAGGDGSMIGTLLVVILLQAVRAAPKARAQAPSSA